MLDEAINELTKQMIKNKFEGKEETYIITKTELYQFAIKLIKKIKEFTREKSDKDANLQCVEKTNN